MNSLPEDDRLTHGYQALGQHIKQLRTSQGLSLREAGRRAGVDPTWWGRLEDGLYVSPDPRGISKVARALGVDAEELFVVAGLSTGHGLPSFTPYLRAKYDLPPHAVAQLEAHFELLNEKYQSKGETDDRNHRGAA
jgi:transcriptional regulator with XRE-family HTH domain